VTTPHFFVESLHEGSLALSAPDSRHALRSLRLRPGEEVTFADGRGAVGRGRVRGEEEGLAVVEVDTVSRVERRVPAVSIAMSAPKGERLSWAVQKLAELSVDELALVDTERSVRGWDSVRAERALARLRAVAREAAMQSRRPFVMEVRAAGAMRDQLAVAGGDLVVLWEGATAPLSGALREQATAIRLLVGPEGGFSLAEVDAARGAGAALVSLGSGVLRTETAAMVGAALVLARYGRLG